MSPKLLNYIDGQWLESRSAQVLSVLNPANQEELATVGLFLQEER